MPIEGTFRAHQVRLSTVCENPEHLRMLGAWIRKYRPDELFDKEGRLVAELAALAPDGDRRMGANPHVNGGRMLKALDLHYVLGIKVRVVNVVDLNSLMRADDRLHGMDNSSFNALFTRDVDVIFAFYGYRWLIHSGTWPHERSPVPCARI